jgi:hypothetical protein
LTEPEGRFLNCGVLVDIDRDFEEEKDCVFNDFPRGKVFPATVPLLTKEELLAGGFSLIIDLAETSPFPGLCLLLSLDWLEFFTLESKL